MGLMQRLKASLELEVILVALTLAILVNAFVIMTALLVAAKRPPELEPAMTTTAAELALCMATSQRAIEVLDSLNVWVQRSRPGARR